MKHSLFGLAAAAAVTFTLLGCPAEERKDTTTTTTTTTTTETQASPAGEATGPAAATTGSAAPTPVSSKAVQQAAATVDAKAIFSQKCAGCHGANGGGAVGPALSNVEAKGDAHIKEYIVNGSPNKVMPAFGTQLKAEEVEALVAYVKTL